MRTVSAILCVVALSGCGILKANSPEAELFDCRATALESILGSREAAVAAAREVYSGRERLATVVAAAAPRLEDVNAAVRRLLSDLEACQPAPAVRPDAGTAE